MLKREVDPIIPDAHRREVFAALLTAQDNGLEVAASRQLVASQFSLEVEDVRSIEREGLDQKWPPL